MWSRLFYLVVSNVTFGLSMLHCQFAMMFVAQETSELEAWDFNSLEEKPMKSDLSEKSIRVSNT